MAANVIKREFNTPLFSLNDYVINHYIHYGRFGHFHFCQTKKDESKNFLLKVLKKSVILEKKLFDKIKQEIEMYEKLKHPFFFPKLIGIATNDPKYLGLFFNSFAYDISNIVR